MISPDRDREGMRRILLALDYDRDQAMLEAAARLAGAMRASLQAVFVEDEELRRLAQLPFACEVGFGSAVVRRMELSRLERDLKNRAAELERLLRRRAARDRVHWSFSVTRGALPAAALKATPGADLYILPRHGSRYTEERRRAPGAIATLLDGSPESQRALEAAATLADGSTLHVLVPAGEDRPALRDRVTPLLRHLRHPAVFLPIDDSNPETIAAAVRQLRAGLLVVGRTDRYRDPEMLRSLQAATGTPLILAA